MNTILAYIRRPMANMGTYVALSTNESVENTVRNIIQISSLSDDSYDIMVYHKRTDMPDTEAIFYYIRNAFAHGSFEVKSNGKIKIYLLESRKNDIIKAQMRLREKTLLEYAKISQMNASDIKQLRR